MKAITLLFVILCLAWPVRAQFWIVTNSGNNMSGQRGWTAFVTATNIAGHAGLTNATRLGVFRLRDVFTNKFATLQAGANVTLTDEGTNILISADSSLTNGLATISFVTNFYRAGSIGLTKLELTKAVTFTGNLADTNYAVFLSASTNTVLWYSNKTVSGFTLRVTVGLTGRVDYIAIPQR